MTGDEAAGANAGLLGGEMSATIASVPSVTGRGPL